MLEFIMAKLRSLSNFYKRRSREGMNKKGHMVIHLLLASLVLPFLLKTQLDYHLLTFYANQISAIQEMKTTLKILKSRYLVTQERIVIQMLY